MPRLFLQRCASVAALVILASLAASKPATAAPVELDQSRVVNAADARAIDKAAAAYLAESVDGNPGLWLAVWDPKRGYYEQAYGSAVSGGRKASTKDVMYVGSITKTALATAVLEEVAKGAISLGDTVGQLSPALAAKFPAIASISVRDLLGMTSGIPDYADAAVAQMLVNPQKRYSRDDLIALGLASGEQKPVGTAAYSTTNYIILGELLQAVTGQSPERLVNAVLREAGLGQARLPSSDAKQPARITHGYVGRLLPTQLPDVAVPPPATDVTDWAFDWGREGGGAYATIGDLAQWGSTCLGNSLLPTQLVRQRLRTHTSNAGQYGLGIIRQGQWLAHSGQALGWTANVACNPKTGAVVAYATNSTNGTFDVPFKVGKVAFPAYAKAIAYGAL